ncbi:MAG: DegV family protein [Coriobacteriia bacterium]|nr:DegV family protein [Coriobacteriia bacterium]
MAVKLLIDSTNYLSPEDIERFGMRQVSLYINDGDKHDRELDLDYSDFYTRLADTTEIPTSAQPSHGAIIKEMSEIISEGDEVLGLTISSEMSGTYDSFCMAAEQIKEKNPDAVIEIVDTWSNCLQEGFAVLSAAEVAAAGGTMQECIDAAEATIARTRFVFAPHTLEYLERGGRIGTAAALLGSVLKLVPILSVEDGSVVTLSKVRTYPKALASLSEHLHKDIDAAGGLKRIAVHTIADSEHAQAFADTYIEPLVGHPLDIVPIGPVIGAHVGPAVGVVYETNDPLR